MAATEGSRAVFSSVRSSSRIRRRGALSLRLRAQTLSRTGRGWVASAERRPASCCATSALCCRSGLAQAMENPTSPGTGEVASLSEPERALSRGRSWSDPQSAPENRYEMRFAVFVQGNRRTRDPSSEIVLLRLPDAEEVVDERPERRRRL